MFIGCENDQVSKEMNADKRVDRLKFSDLCYVIRSLDGPTIVNFALILNYIFPFLIQILLFLLSIFSFHQFSFLNFKLFIVLTGI